MSIKSLPDELWERSPITLSRKGRRSLIAWAGLIPALAILIIYRLIPLLWNVALSFENMRYTGETTWVGAENYQRMLEDPVFMDALFNTILFLLSVPIAVTIALGLALLLNKNFPGSNAFRSMFFLPYITMMVAIAVIWSYMFKTQGGVINYMLLEAGLIEENIGWLSDSWWARASIIIVHVWKTTGFYLIIILAGLQNISPQIYEVSRIDGASKRQRFMYITLPLLKPTLGVCALVGLVTSFELFDLVQVLTGGGPARSTEILITWIYKQAFEFGNFGYSAALTIVLFVIMAGFSLLGAYLQGGDYI
ncbi:carbohydrate ABC transporter permease [Natrinema gelatinilyticum]|uniref:carbohydrate ABC transporter permease n=1 Tax=Natrinema gelatinilyticum TaxID=2961571 RepID=UPI0020C371EA|nr:sugar ABC transporter permease [Natrinema gelatinilyticum]